jgi:hypothetical protein
MNKNKIDIVERVEDIEGSPLYHHTSEERAINIMNQDKLRGSLPSDEYLSLDKRLSQTPSQSAISLTRDKNFIPGITIGASWDKPKDLNVVFVLDSNKIKTRYKVEPFNYSSIDPRIFDDLGYEKNPEMEERVLTKNISPLHKYVTKIIYKGNDQYVKNKINQFMAKKEITEQFQLNELSDDSSGVQEFLKDVKDTPGLMKHLGFNRLKSLEVYIREGGYEDFEELKSDAKKFHDKNKKNIKEEIKEGKVVCDNCGWSWDLSEGGKDKYLCHKCGNDNEPSTLLKLGNIKEQITEEGLNRSTVKLFKILNTEKKNLKTRANILEFLTKALKLIGLNPDLALYYLELYVLNYRKDGNYESLSKNEIKDPKSQKGRTISNTQAWMYTKAQMPFKGSNLSSYWKNDSKGVPVYVVLSYGWYPIFVYKKGIWYQIVDSYSSSTGRQISNSNPNHWKSYNENVQSDVYWMNKDELRKLINYASHDEIMKEKLERFKEKGKESSTQKLKNVSRYYPNIKIKFKIKSIEEEDGVAVVNIDVLDVLRKEGQKGIETSDNYTKGEIDGVTKESVENTIVSEIGSKFREFMGKGIKYDSEGVPKTDNVQFKFNHLREK